MKKSILALFLCLLTLLSALLPVGAATLPSHPLLAETRQALEEALGKDTPGASVGIYQNGALLSLEGYGYADTESRVLVNPETAFELGELSSIFVALSVYRLAAEGKLDPNADIARYLPEDFVRALRLEHAVTLRQLLRGTAGFEGRTFDMIFEKESHTFDSLKSALLADVPQQIHAPDAYYSASPFGIALAAYTVECVAGENYADYVTGKLLTPLGMTHTVFALTADRRPENMASGHLKTGEGMFAVAADRGDSYAGLYPVSGMISTGADLSLLLHFLLNGNESILPDAARLSWLTDLFQNGLFKVSAPGLSAYGNAVGADGKTLYYGASLWLDISTRQGAFVLTNTAESTLLSLPKALCAGEAVTPADGGGNLPELKVFCKTYALSTGEKESFVGLMRRREENIKAEANDSGQLLFGDMVLQQVAPCQFAYADAPEKGVVLQFVLNSEGKVEAALTPEGKTYLPVSFAEQGVPGTVLFFLLLLLTVWFFFAGIFSLTRYIINRYDRDHPGFIFTLPLLFSTLMSAFMLLQMWIGYALGGSAFSSVFDALAVVTLICAIGAAFSFVLAFMGSLTHRRMPGKVAREAGMFLIFFLLANYFGLTVL